MTTHRQPPAPQALPAGLYPARCSGLIDLGTHADSPRPTRQDAPGGRCRRLILLTFTVFLQDGGTLRQSRQFALSTDSRSGLFKFLTPWLGTTWHREGAIRAAHITEQPCLLNLQHSEATNPASGQPWLNIVSASPLLAGMSVPDLRWPARIFSLRAPDRATFLRLPAWMSRRIRASQEWQQLAKATGTTRKPKPSHV